MPRRLLSLAFCGLASLLHAQEAPPDIPAPTKPAVAEPHAGTSWDVTVDYPTTKTASPAQQTNAANRLRGIHCERGKAAGRRATHISLLWTTGKPSESYVFNTFAILVPADDSHPIRINLRENDYLLPQAVEGYPGAGWITLKQYVGVEKINEEFCYKFFHPADQPTPGQDAILEPEMTAWVRVSDKTPVRIIVGDAVYNFSPIKTIPPALVLPDSVLEMLKKIDQQQKLLQLLEENSH